MILLAGIPSEPPMALAAASAAALGLPLVMLNQRAFLYDDIELRLSEGVVEGTLTVAGQMYPLGAFTGIYLRTVEPDALPELRARRGKPVAPTGAARGAAWTDILTAWTEIAPQRVVNRLSATLSNFSKPYQSQLIAACGFAVPATLVSDDPAAVRAFADHHGKVIYKSVSAIRSIVKMLDDAASRQLARIRCLPTQFQEFIPGDNIRVHVIGPDVYSVRIASDAVDYRYAGRDGIDVDMTPYQLPAEVEDRCLRLSAMLALPFCGIDLKLRPDGVFFCFEVNPSPAYSYYQEQTGMPISDALVRYLAGISRGSAGAECRSP